MKAGLARRNAVDRMEAAKSHLHHERDLETEVRKMKSSSRFIHSGWVFGSALAMTISWSTHQSVLLAILHGALSWFYIIYYAVA